MYRILRAILNSTWLLSPLTILQDPLIPQEAKPPEKSILIVGGGSAGLAALKTLFDLPERTRGNWEILLYEQRDDVGGIWLPDPNPPDPPNLPETPLYPSLHTNVAAPFMTYPNFPVPAGTALFPSHEYILQYHRDYASHFDLMPHIRLNHSVLTPVWIGNATHGHWSVTTRMRTVGSVFHKRFDHVIVASGHNHYPHAPTWEGVEGWLDNTPQGTPKREIIHSIYYREPERYRGRTVVVLVAGGSGKDAAQQIAPLARKLYQSVGTTTQFPIMPPAIRKPKISHFTNDSIVFIDGTSTSSADSLVLGTGYELRVPFLTAGRALTVDQNAHSPLNSSAELGHLITNLRYIRPLWRHTLSLSSEFPLGALYFVGLPVLTSPCHSSIAQSLLVANMIADPSILPSRSELLAELRRKEQELRDGGHDPDYVGHHLVSIGEKGESLGSDFQEEIVNWLRDRGISIGKGKFVSDWRRWVGQMDVMLTLARAWSRVEEIGEKEVGRWVDGLESEDDWASMMHKLFDLQKEKENP